jgi:hypothetical protein
MRLMIFFFGLAFSFYAQAADMTPAGTAQAEARAEREAIEAERAAKEKAEKEAAEAQRAAKEQAERTAAEADRARREEAARIAAAEAERAAKEAAEREAAAKAEREAKETAEREAKAKAEREAREAAEREAAAKAARAAKEAEEREAKEKAEREATLKAEREIREAAEREAKANAERALKEAGEREAAAQAQKGAQEAAERDAAAKAAQNQTPVMAAAMSSAPDVICGTPGQIQNSVAVSAITERAKADAGAHAQAAAQLTIAAQESVSAMANGYALDRKTVSRTYFVALCKELTAKGGAPDTLKPMLTYIADVLGLSYAELAAESGGKPAKAEAEEKVRSQGGTAEQAAKPQAVAEAEKPAAAPVAAPPPPAASPSEQPAAAGESKADRAEPPAAPAAPPGAGIGGGAQPRPVAEAPAAQPAPSSAAPAPDAAKSQPAASPPPASDDAATRTAGQPAGDKQAAPGRPAGALGAEECRLLGVLTGCTDLNAVLGQLLEKPVEYNHPKQMLLGRKSEIALVLRTDWEGKDLPSEVSKEFKDLPGEVKQGLSKITQIMSAELAGRDFEVSPSGRQERTVVPPQPVTWNWQVTPNETGGGKTLKLRLYAHVQGPQGAMPPILVKTLDATIDVDVTTWDWFVNQARTFEPVYAVLAALVGLLTAFFTFILARRRRAAGHPETGGYSDKPNPWERLMGKRSGPVIGDLDQSASDSRPPAPPAADDGKKDKGPGEGGAG